jgi:hypothetical protein
MTTIKLTKLQAEEIAYRLSINEDSQTETYPEDRLPVWGSVNGLQLTITDRDNCLDDIDEITDRWSDYAASGEADSFAAYGSVRSMIGLRAKIVDAFAMAVSA